MTLLSHLLVVFDVHHPPFIGPYAAHPPEAAERKVIRGRHLIYGTNDFYQCVRQNMMLSSSVGLLIVGILLCIFISCHAKVKIKTSQESLT